VHRTIRITTTPTAGGWTCQVRIEEDGRKVSDHTVKVSTADLQRLAPAGPVEDLVLQSFEFLLDREPASSILRRFALTDIERYFPDFADVIRA
jgi:hypothetical protein